MKQLSKRSEATFVFLLVILALCLLQKWPLARNTGLPAPMLFIWIPCLLSLAGRLDTKDLGLDTGNLRGSAKGFGISLILMALFSALYLFVIRKFIPYTSVGQASEISLAQLLTFQFAFVALPEEFFFRGYLQSRLSTGKHSYRSIIFTSLLFALSHLAVQGNIRRLEVFFPGLLFGWLRRKSGAIWLPIIIHALCNVLFYYLLTSQY